MTQKVVFRIHNLDDDQLIKWATSLTVLNKQSLSVPFLSLRKASYDVTKLFDRLPLNFLKQLTLFQKILYERRVPAGHSDTQTFNFLKLEDFINNMADVRTSKVEAITTEVRIRRPDRTSSYIQTFLRQLLTERQTTILDPGEIFKFIYADNSWTELKTRFVKKNGTVNQSFCDPRLAQIWYSELQG